MITVEDLIKILSKEDPDRSVIIAGDPEGNYFMPLDEVSADIWLQDEDRLYDAKDDDPLEDIDKHKDCGPWREKSIQESFRGKDIWGEERHWICDFHEGFDAGIDAVRRKTA